MTTIEQIKEAEARLNLVEEELREFADGFDDTAQYRSLADKLATAMDEHLCLTSEFRESHSKPENF